MRLKISIAESINFLMTVGFLLITALLFLVHDVFSQEAWVNPRLTALYPSGDYQPLPQYTDNYVHPSSTARVFHTPIGTVVVAPNFRVHPTNGTQSEVIITRNPRNQNIILGSANTYAGGLFISEGVYVSTDAGVTWYGSDTCTLEPTHLGDPGPVIDNNNIFIMTHLMWNQVEITGVGSNSSVDNGVTWTPTSTITGGLQDKNLAGTDDDSTSLFYGRTYCVWSWFTTTNPWISVSFSNGGIAWSPATPINSPDAGHYSQGCDVRVGPGGVVYVCWAAPLAGSPYTEDFAGFASSSTGGVTWTVAENAYDMNGIRGTLPQKAGIRVNGFTRIDVDRSGGPRNGWIYIVAGEKNLSPAGSDPDVIMHRSTNGGQTWSAGIRVNQDALNNGKIQYFPCIRVDEAGGVNVVYYDDRVTSSDSSGMFLSRSLDGGTTWTDVEITDHHFKPKPIPGLAGGYQGDYIGVTSGNGKLWPLWMSDKSGIYQAWTTGVDISLVGIENENGTVPSSYLLQQNYPNPFNPSTTIKFSVPKDGDVRMTIYDITGRVSDVLVNEFMKAGNYVVKWNGQSFSSGIYFYKIQAGSFTDSRKMILVK